MSVGHAPTTTMVLNRIQVELRRLVKTHFSVGGCISRDQPRLIPRAAGKAPFTTEFWGRTIHA